MRRLPWHVPLRADRRALLTSLGVSVGVAFCVVGFTLVSALEGEAISPEGRFASPHVMVSRGGAEFDASALPVDPVVRVLLYRAQDVDGVEHTLAAIEAEGVPPVVEGDARPGTAAGLQGRERLDLAAPSSVSFGLGPVVDAEFLDPGWVLVSPPQLRALAGVGSASVTYALLPAEARMHVADLEAAGFEVSMVPGVEPFYSSSAIEISRILLLLVAFSSLLVGLFAHEFLRTEIRERRRELGLWRSVGMRVRDVATLLVARGAFIVTLGSAMGFFWALLVLTTAARVLGSRIFDTLPSVAVSASLFAAFVATGMVGAALPAITEARRPVREWLEALV